MYKYTVMIVDDDSDCIVLLSGLLHHLGYNVLSADSKHSAMDLLDSDVHIDVLLTDLRLGDGLGSDILAEMGTRSPTIITILMTGWLKYPSQAHQNFDDYMVKPLDTRLLEQTIVSLLRIREQDVKTNNRRNAKAA